MMDIEDYLERKRSLEAKKELLEAKEHLKEDAEKKKRELEREKKRMSGEKPGAVVLEARERNELSPVPHEVGMQDMFRKMLLWNTIIVVLVLGLFAFLYFTPFDGEVDTSSTTNSNVVTGSTVITTTEKNQTNDTQQQQPPTNQQQPPPEPITYPGPEFDFYAEDEELGPFDSSGKIGGENLVITSSYYNDAQLVLENKESSVIKCYIDRQVTVDEDLNGKEELSDFDLDFIVDELDAGEKETFQESLPGSFKEGTYGGEGKVTANYDARCYYCTNAECEGTDGGIDKDGESKDTAKIKFQANPDAT